jgi:glucuronate isomerase
MISTVQTLELHPDRFLGSQENSVAIARRLYAETQKLPIISPHGHTDPSWFAENKPFENPSELLLTPDHYIFRLLYSQGVSLQELGIRGIGAEGSDQTDVTDPIAAWRLFAKHYHMFLGTPSRIWLDHVFSTVFGLNKVLNEITADYYYFHILSALQTPTFLPRALLDRFKIETIATTEGALDSLSSHRKLHEDGLGQRVITTFRPDDVVDPDREDFDKNLEQLAELTGEDTNSWQGYLAALQQRREYFAKLGATATDHGHPSALTADLDKQQCQQLLDKCSQGSADAQEHELFRAQMLTEMAAMSIEDGLVMQLHPGSFRNHNSALFKTFGRDKGADIPLAIEYVRALKPLLDKFGNSNSLSLILFTLDESTYARELAPLAGHYPAVKLGPAWWFHDSPEGMLRYRQQVTETAGFYNTVGFNDDTRALLSIPARHDLARRIDAQFLAEWVAQHRLQEDQALDIAVDLAYQIPKQAYRLGKTKKR